MKSNKIIFVILLFGLGINVIRAQSDYEKTQNFKERYTELKNAIDSASTIIELDSLSLSVQNMKNNFVAEKDLLDKSLYPDDFNGSFQKLNDALELRSKDLGQIETLQMRVSELTERIDELNKRNTDLLAQISEIKESQMDDAKTMASLRNLVNKLKNSIAHRDKLVMSIVDSLMSEFVNHPLSLNDAEKTNIFSKIETGNFFYNMERTINDNIRFLNVTSLAPEDLMDMKDDQERFSKIWRQLGPKLVDVYETHSNKAAEISNINNLFAEWKQKVNEEIWNSVNSNFKKYGIGILQYSNGEEFKKNILAFIDDEMKNYGIKSVNASEHTYDVFVDSVWFNEIKPKWIPLLIENNLMTNAQKDSIEDKMILWKESISPETSYWWYVIIAVIAAVMIYLLIPSKKKKQRLE